MTSSAVESMLTPDRWNGLISLRVAPRRRSPLPGLALARRPVDGLRCSSYACTLAVRSAYPRRRDSSAGRKRLALWDQVSWSSFSSWRFTFFRISHFLPDFEWHTCQHHHVWDLRFSLDQGPGMSPPAPHSAALPRQQSASSRPWGTTAEPLRCHYPPSLCFCSDSGSTRPWSSPLAQHCLTRGPLPLSGGLTGSPPFPQCDGPHLPSALPRLQSVWPSVTRRH